MHYHYLCAGEGANAAMEEVSSDLMSFFFVLSGFVAMYSNDGKITTTLDFIDKRLSKTFPLYLLTTLISAVSSVSMGWPPPTSASQLCAFTEFFLVSAWLPCRITPYFNGAGWYLCTLYWLWLSFPSLRRLVMPAYAWQVAVSVWVLSTLLYSVVWIEHWAWRIRVFPPLRLCEFFIGMLVCSTVHKQVPTGVFLCCVVVVVGYWILAHVYLVYQPGMWLLQYSQHEDPSSVIDPDRVPFTSGLTHATRFSEMQGKFSLLWGVIIQWVACSELSEERDSWWVHWLDNTIFKLLSPFSLQLYLCHQMIHQACSSISRLIHWENAFQIHTYLLAAYTGSYMIFLWVQPLLDSVPGKVLGCFRREKRYSVADTSGQPVVDRT